MSTAQKRLLTQPCLACNREAWQPMCEGCTDDAATQEAEDES